MKKSTIWLLGALNMIGPFTYDAYLGALPAISTELQTTTSLTQFTISANLVGMTLGMMVGGSVSDTFGRRKPVLYAIALYIAASIVIFGAQSIELVIFLRVLQGFAGGAMVSVTQAVVRDQTEGRESAKMFSNLMLIKSIAPILAPVVGAFILLSGNWRLIFLFLAVVGGIFMFWTISTFAEPLPKERRVPFSLSSFGGGWKSVFTDRLFLAAGLTSFLTTFALFGYFSTATFALQGEFGLTPFEFGLFMGVNGCALIAFRSVNTRLLNRISFYHVYQLGVVIGLVCTAIMASSVLVGGNFWLFSAGLLLMTGSIGISMPNSLNLALTNHKNAAGAAAGIFGFIGSVAGFVSTAVVGTLVGTSSLGLAIYIGIPMGLTGLSLLIYRRRDSLAH